MTDKLVKCESDKDPLEAEQLGLNGEVACLAGPAVYSEDVVEHLEKLKKEGHSGVRMLSQSEIELSRKHAKQAGARARANFKARMAARDLASGRSKTGATKSRQSSKHK
ncbi:MAG: hypothetical protein KDI33_00210 [Halioglobus sp.]|nr:hypothetical protein [Halioglobus sp.]